MSLRDASAWLSAASGTEISEVARHESRLARESAWRRRRRAGVGERSKRPGSARQTAEEEEERAGERWHQ